ncbi:hypothetical protein VTO73DRAFT_11247 [Trametes versicolor]
MNAVEQQLECLDASFTLSTPFPCVIGPRSGNAAQPAGGNEHSLRQDQARGWATPPSASRLPDLYPEKVEAHM